MSFFQVCIPLHLFLALYVNDLCSISDLGAD